MSDASDADYQRLLARVRDRDPAAGRDLLARAHPRLRRLAAKILNESYPSVGRGHDVDSVVSDLYIRLAKALESVAPATPADFFRFAAHKVRQVLLDVVQRDARDRRVGPLPDAGSGSTSSVGGFDPATSTLGPSQLAEWTELHRRIDALPDRLKDVFAPHYYLGLSQAEIADALGETPKAVSRRWLEAVGVLAPYLPAGRG